MPGPARTHPSLTWCHKLKRRKGIRWEYNLDGGPHPERIKGADKRYWRRFRRRHPEYY